MERMTTNFDQQWSFDGDLNILLKECNTSKKENQMSLLPSGSSANCPSFNDMLDFYRPGSQKAIHPFSFPLYVLTTKDCFAFDLIEKRTVINMLGRDVIKTGNYTHFLIC